MVKAYCTKCKKKQEQRNPKVSKTKKGTKVSKGTCAKCGAKTAIFVK